MSPYYDGQVVIWHADIREMGALCDVACVITLPPYHSGVAYDGYEDSLPDSEYHALAAETCRLISVSLPPDGGRAWIKVGVARLTVWLDAIRRAGMTERHIVCWDYGIATSDTAWGSWLTPSAPHVCHAWEPIVWATTREWRRHAPAGLEHWRDPLGGWADMTRGMWRIPPGESTRTAHLAVMPVALAERCIRLSTWPGEVVADPFAGSGTTLFAAKRLGRRGVGVERSERYRGIAAARLAQQVLSVAAGWRDG